MRDRYSPKPVPTTHGCLLGWTRLQSHGFDEKLFLDNNVADHQAQQQYQLPLELVPSA